MLIVPADSFDKEFFAGLEIMATPSLLKLWEDCQRFVGAVCADRDETHGLAHMQQVTEHALLILSLELPSRLADLVQDYATRYGTSTITAEAITNALYERVLVVAMLHDVNDHKYDKDGTLDKTVRDFGVSIASRLRLIDQAECGSDHDPVSFLSASIMETIGAISFSKEKRYGARWFEAKLPSRLWVLVRDVVSDADKLEAIGAAGLQRSFDYNIASRQEDGSWEQCLAQGAEAAALAVFKDVDQHCDDKLLRLASEYVITGAGRFLAAPRHDELKATLQLWKVEGPPKLNARQLQLKA